MKLIFILFVISMTLSYYYHITKIYLDSKTYLSKYYDTSFFYIEANGYDSKDIYFCLEDDYDSIDTNLKVCYSDIDPLLNEKKAIENCYFRSLDYYNYQKESSYYKYYYKINYYDFSYKSKVYIIVGYSANSISGSLYVTYDYNDLFEQGGGLKTTTIILVAISSFFGLVLIVICIVYFCICMKRKTIQGNVGYIEPIPNEVVTNPPGYPLMAPNPNYSNYAH